MLKFNQRKLQNNQQHLPSVRIIFNVNFVNDCLINIQQNVIFHCKFISYNEKRFNSKQEEICLVVKHNSNANNYTRLEMRYVLQLEVSFVKGVYVILLNSHIKSILHLQHLLRKLLPSKIKENENFLILLIISQVQMEDLFVNL